MIDTDADGLTLDDGYENMAGHTQNALFSDDCAISEAHILTLGKNSFKRYVE